MDLQFEYIPSNRIMWQSRIILSTYSDGSKNCISFAGVQKARAELSGNINVTVQFLVFDVPDWDNRIYLYEPGLYYDFNFPVCYGTGQKIVSVLTVKLFREITLACKGSLITYLNAENIGSGNDMIVGNKRWDVGLQIRIRL